MIEDAHRPSLPMQEQAFREITCDLMYRSPEAGGLLLGPIGQNRVTRFHFDASGACSGSTYSPDHRTLRRLMSEEWIPSGLDMKGFAHSHPGQLDRLSAGDLAYIARLLAANPDMDVFFAPLVLPAHFRFCPLIVQRRDPTRAIAARLELFR